VKGLPAVELNQQELENILQRALSSPLAKEDYEKLHAVLETLAYMTQLLENKNTTVQRLRQIVFGASTEKTSQVLQTAASQDPSSAASAVTQGPTNAVGSEEPCSGPVKEERSPGHGRNGAQAYAGAEKIKVEHATLKAGDRCPKCEKGKVYAMATPGVLVRLVGQAPLAATVYELEKLRCNLCGEVFTAEPPARAGPDKYDATAASMIALLKYGSGLPFHRLQGLQGNLGTPLPASTQWEIMAKTAPALQPAYQELIQQAAQGEVIYNDDTSMKILALMGKHQPRPESEETEQEEEEDSERTGIFTSGIVSTRAGQKIALFFTGRKHAGENLATVLAQRARELGPPIQMCDGLDRNVPKDFQTIVSNCLLHGRRKFVEVVTKFPDECRYLLETLREVYKHDAFCREQGMSPEERLAYHQSHSAPLMAALEKWFAEQFAERKAEPNSGLGQAITYMQKRWDRLTLFLRQAGAPLDSNAVERILKRAILHRKNAYFYKTENGARVGDLFMSLIHTCQLHGVNAFEYLTELQKHAEELTARPPEWMPWNYRNRLRSANIEGR
jgi:transposase